MPQTRSRSASQRRNINDNTGNNISAMVNRTSNNNQMDNMTSNSIGSTINISNGNGTSAGSNLIGQIGNETMVNGSSDSLDIEINQENRNTINSKVHVQIYKGFNDKLSIENWFKRFELIAKLKKWNQNEKIIMLGNFLEDDALNWYLENCDTENWLELKTNLEARFSLGTIDPMTDFVNLKYDFKTGLKDYFEKKRRLGVLAKLNESQIVPIMIQGLHPKFKSHFLAVQPQNYIEFYRIAKAIEDNLNENFKFDKNKNYTKSKLNDKKSNDNKNLRKKPPSACRICEGLGFKKRFHWASDCKNKNKNSNSYVNTNPNSNSKQVNITDKQESESIANYPILENITLN